MSLMERRATMIERMQIKHKIIARPEHHRKPSRNTVVERHGTSITAEKFPKSDFEVPHSQEENGSLIMSPH